VSEDELRFLRSSFGMLGRQVRELATYVEGLTAISKATFPNEEWTEAHREIEEGIAELLTSLARFVDAFPAEWPGGRNGGG
jgi:hypothetical protein